jgi:hypothetical protein
LIKRLFHYLASLRRAMNYGLFAPAVYRVNTTMTWEVTVPQYYDVTVLPILPPALVHASIEVVHKSGAVYAPRVIRSVVVKNA